MNGYNKCLFNSYNSKFININLFHIIFINNINLIFIISYYNIDLLYLINY